jgi:hypothetical protein
VALLKRAVLKRCVYGVDLNAMAVELAKVSLWLDAFTLGAPLSFLDHHLKRGNSLIGARVKDVQKALESREQPSLLAGSKFAGVMLATDLMRQVSYLSDNTAEQLASSRQAFRSAGDYLAPYKRVLDVYTSRWFGNPAHKSGFEPVLDFLGRPDVEAWLQDPRTPLPERDYMEVARIGATALAAADEKHFFHWELEFPEVFFAPSTPGGQDVQLREVGGFDAVMGNPPYLPTEQLEDSLRVFLNGKFALEGKYESSVPFTEMGLGCLLRQGRVGMITPIMWQTGENYSRFRTDVFGCRFQPVIVVNLPFNVFPDAYIDTGIQVLSTESGGPPNIRALGFAKQEDVAEISDNDNRWGEIPILYMREEPGMKLYVDINQYNVRRKFRNPDEFTTVGAATESCQGIVESFYSYSPVRDARYPLEYRNLDAYRYESSITDTRFINLGPENHLYRFYTQPRILIRRIVNRSNRLMATVADQPFVVRKDLNPFILRSAERFDIHYVLALVNSTLLSWIYTGGSAASLRDDYRQTTLGELNALPIRLVGVGAPHLGSSELYEQIALLRPDALVQDSDSVTQFAAHSLAEGKSYAVHDLLVHLTQRMMGLHTSRQTEIRRFLSWLETRLRIRPKDGETGIDSLTGKSELQNYLGDYQKGEPERPWGDFFYRLHRNRGRFAADLDGLKGEIQGEYEKSLAVLLPIKRQLGATDDLIDKIVYKLYGLTDEEIEIVERPAYEQALVDAKAGVLQDKRLQADPDAAAGVIADAVLPAATRLQGQLAMTEERRQLDADLPGWHLFPEEVVTFLLTGEYNIRTQPESLDFSTSVITFSKAVEAMLVHRLFMRFRDESGCTDADCGNEFLKKFMRNQGKLTLGNFSPILGSSSEVALRAFTLKLYPRAAETFFGPNGVVTGLNDPNSGALRNRAAHDEALSKEDARTMRIWALGILRYL